VIVTRSIDLGGRRTSLRLEAEFWDALEDIADREGQSLDGLCMRIDAARRALSRAAAVRVHVVEYYLAVSGVASR